jgi:hypothetical protein
MRRLRNNGVVIVFGVLVATAGAAGWVLVYSGVAIWLALAAAALIVVFAIGAFTSLTSASSSELLAWSPAFVLLTWAPIWLVVVLIRALLTGHSIGS